ncbi:MAG: hypothetical protein Q7S87_14885 [Agitococcus sp.]|nr:hypothetical protein [Agitococcus sp.]
MKRVIISVFTLALSPLIMAEQSEDILSSSSKETAYSIDTSTGKTKTEKPNENDVKKPRLENFASYNEFLKAMYLYKKNEEETIRPNVDIRPPPSSVKKELESTPIEDNKDVTLWGEELPSEYVILGE